MELENLDEIIQGFSKLDFVIIKSRSCVGKTAFALIISNNMCVKQNRSVGFFTLEMKSKFITKRLISLNANIEYYKLNKQFLDNSK
ncbi:DnaB-like helicase C-terminal domain-containing protein (plasmid) [Borreliella yangtzensis]|uniref:DnaB-like helicase C-terminal domain-containing protein n=1 Tax=Borreliella yangtzensis TaxID=683292 RepID=UPI003B224071